MATIKQKLNDTQKRNIKRIVPMLVAKIDRAGGILPIAELQPSYGDAVIQQAVEDKDIALLTVNRRDISGAEPDRQIRAAHTRLWNGDKPAWLV